MNARILGHTLAILASTLIPWFWYLNEDLSPYSLQLAGATIILYTAFRFFLRRGIHKKNESLLNLVFINSLTQLLILTTGKKVSPIFSLLYLIIFAVALIFEPYQAALISFATSLLIVISNSQNISIRTITIVIELISVTPLAIIFSQNYLKNLESKGKIKLLEDALKQEEVDGLLWISTSAKPSINSIFNSISDILIYLNSSRHNLDIPKNLIDKIKHIQSDLLTLYTSTEQLKSTLEEESDNNNI